MKKNNNDMFVKVLGGKEFSLSEYEAYINMLKNKVILSPDEASILFSIGISSIRSHLAKPDCPFVVHVGSHKKVEPKAFEKYILEGRLKER